MGTYVVTGGASGIGAAIGAHLASEGHKIVSVDIQASDVVADLGSAAGRESAITAIKEAVSDGFDGLITSAGLGSHVPNPALITAVNFFGTVDLIDGLKDELAKNNAPVVLVSSNSAPMETSQDFIDKLLDADESAAAALAAEMPPHQVYSGTKQAVTRWMRRNTAAYASQGVRLNAIGPGYTRTPLSAAVEEDPNFTDAIQQFIATIPIGRPGVPQDMANATSFLLSEQASFICGAMLFIDGGHDAAMRPDQF